MRSVRGFHFDKAAASVLTSCVSKFIDYLQAFFFFFFYNRQIFKLHIFFYFRCVCAKIIIYFLDHD